MIAFQNHPSGLASPSNADELLTQRLVEALQLIDVRLLDHLIIGDTQEYSFGDRATLARFFHLPATRAAVCLQLMASG